MASPHLDIAKVSFSALLLRPDPVAQSRAEIDDFLRLLDAAISRCSPPNVQKCKQWILANIAHSAARTTALVKYLTALARSLTQPLLETRQAREPSSRRKRLHILYILNDALYHTHVRNHDNSFSTTLEPGLSELLRLASSYTHCPRHTKKLNDLLELWRSHTYFTATSADKLVAVVRDAPKSIDTIGSKATDGSRDTATATSKTAKDAPYVMPAMHGDATAAWYDLPAANWLPVIEPNSTRPMNPDMIKPLQLKAGPAETQLIDAVKALLADADRLYAKEHAIGQDDDVEVDQLGQPVIRDEVTGEIIDGQTYYGWSRGFCGKMKTRRQKNRYPGSEGRSRGRSSPRSRSLSRTPSRSRTASPPASKRRRTSTSRSRSLTRSRGRSSRQGRSYGSSTSRSRSPSRDLRDNRSRSRNRSRSHSPTTAKSGQYPQNGHRGGQIPLDPSSLPKQQYHQPPFIPPVPPPPFPVAPDFSNFPGLPPRPPNYQGPWPPPPPPPLGMGAGFPQGFWPPNMPGLPGMMMGGWNAAVPPPPPPPPSQDQYSAQQYEGGAGHQYGRGNHGGYRGQGQRGGGRGRGRGW